MALEKIINTAYSFGAAIVVFGAWAKIEHKDFSDDALTTGLMVETAIFVLYGILEWRPGKKSSDPVALPSPPEKAEYGSQQPAGHAANVEELNDTMKQTNRILSRVFRGD
ncbi:MAG TPA: hypothetical protein VNU72_12585 [Puia sp.]|nr:hypothetical protein [Puia sp.]